MVYELHTEVNKGSFVVYATDDPVLFGKYKESNRPVIGLVPEKADSMLDISCEKMEPESSFPSGAYLLEVDSSDGMPTHLQIEDAYLQLVVCRTYEWPYTIAQSKHLVVRELAEDDVDEIYRLQADLEAEAEFPEAEAESWEYMAAKPLPTREEELERIVAYRRTMYEPWDIGIYGIFLDGEMIGRVGAEPDEAGDWQLGYVIAPKHRQKGYAKEALEAFLSYINEREMCDVLVCTTSARNAASKALINSFAEQYQIEIRYK